MSGDVESLHRFARELQLVAGRLADGSPEPLAVALVGAVERLPAGLHPATWWTVRGLVTEAVTRLLPQTCFSGSELQVRRAIASASSPRALAILLAHTLRVSRRPPDGLRLDIRVDRALAYIRLHCTRPTLVLDDAARHVRMSRWHLSRLLHRHAGTSFRDLVRRERMGVAVRLLLESELSVKEIAAHLGYPHASEFDRQFKQSFRVTPLAWRRDGGPP
jgi:AraC-like DNA-binding protein